MKKHKVQYFSILLTAITCSYLFISSEDVNAQNPKRCDESIYNWVDKYYIGSSSDIQNKVEKICQSSSWLEKHSLSLDDYEEIVYENLIYGKLVAYLFADKVEPYFSENKLDYTSAVIYEIVLDDEDLAMELFYGIQEGKMSFYDVAHQYIQDFE